jgi:hypothetical protein
MQVRITPKMLVVRFSDYRKRHGNEWQYGPADVYYCRKHFARTAQIYGWGDDANPTQIVEYMGDKGTLFDTLHLALYPVRVRYL